jgi:hypothetical protein
MRLARISFALPSQQTIVFAASFGTINAEPVECSFRVRSLSISVLLLVLDLGHRRIAPHALF